ncbi:hypothetical protein QBC34DRAFT_476716 [Podospora aff. communis PSN243]|uniref:Uncharacterized protein n=1 Tax=Podospora aff. communis PSN243 TaxID=3040156 RepID=A0AAV9G7Z4_9PEZI|nr:hypothetical protein QBC34DRAFT_476716 [Podospora aff. communis PSN243]
MHFTSSFFLATVLCLAVASPVAEPTLALVFDSGPILPGSPMAEFTPASFLDSGPITEGSTEPPPQLQARDSCGSNIFNVQHAISMANELQNVSPNDLTFVGKTSWVSWTYGEARICIYNNYIFENTHIKRWEAGWVTGYIYNRCCNPGGNNACAGGDATCHGDSGLSLRANLQNSAFGC